MLTKSDMDKYLKNKEKRGNTYINILDRTPLIHDNAIVKSELLHFKKDFKPNNKSGIQ